MTAQMLVSVPTPRIESFQELVDSDSMGSILVGGSILDVIFGEVSHLPDLKYRKFKGTMTSMKSGYN